MKRIMIAVFIIIGTASWSYAVSILGTWGYSSTNFQPATANHPYPARECVGDITFSSQTYHIWKACKRGIAQKYWIETRDGEWAEITAQEFHADIDGEGCTTVSGCFEMLVNQTGDMATFANMYIGDPNGTTPPACPGAFCEIWKNYEAAVLTKGAGMSPSMKDAYCSQHENGSPIEDINGHCEAY